jgi:hypothetical protein
MSLLSGTEIVDVAAMPVSAAKPASIVPRGPLTRLTWMAATVSANATTAATGPDASALGKRRSMVAAA